MFYLSMKLVIEFAYILFILKHKKDVKIATFVLKYLDNRNKIVYNIMCNKHGGIAQLVRVLA